MTKGMAARAYIGQRGPCRPPPNGRQAPVGRGGRQASFFCQGPRCEFEEKKLHLGPVALWGRPEDIFEIFQNRHIFLKFLFFKNIKKKKAQNKSCSTQPSPVQIKWKLGFSRPIFLSTGPPTIPTAQQQIPGAAARRRLLRRPSAVASWLQDQRRHGRRAVALSRLHLRRRGPPRRPWPRLFLRSPSTGTPSLRLHSSPLLCLWNWNEPSISRSRSGGTLTARPRAHSCCCCCCGNRTPCGGSRARGCISASPSLFEMVGSMDMVPGLSCASSKRKGLLPMSIGYVKLWVNILMQFSISLRVNWSFGTEVRPSPHLSVYNWKVIPVGL